MAKYYSFNPVKVASFKEPFGFTLIGFWYLGKEEKKELSLQVNQLLLKGSFANLQKLENLLKEAIAFCHLYDGNEKLLYKVRYVKIPEYLNADENFLQLVSKFLGYLEEETPLQQTLDENLLNFFSFLVEEEKDKTILTEKDKSLETFVDFDAYDRKLKQEKELKLFEQESLRIPSEAEAFFEVESLEDITKYKWETTYIIGEEFPLFKENIKALEMQMNFRRYTSFEGTLPADLILKCWELYRKESDFIDFLSFTHQCQLKLNEV